jgi:hypothetical protein
MTNTTVADEWHGDGVIPGGDVGGDYQVTESYSVRYSNPAKPGRLVDVYFYGEAQDYEGTGPFKVAQQTGYVICRDVSDPGGTEEFADYVYAYPKPGTTYDTAEEAQEAAQWLALSHVPSQVAWNGEPFYSGGPVI